MIDQDTLHRLIGEVVCGRRSTQAALVLADLMEEADWGPVSGAEKIRESKRKRQTVCDMFDVGPCPLCRGRKGRKMGKCGECHGLRFKGRG